MKEAYDYLKTLATPQSPMVVAVSGGPDSMALLDLCIRLKQEVGVTIIIAHVNHQVRKESADEEIFVRQYCEDHEILFELLKIEGYGSGNFHEEARTKRYQFFEQVVKKYGASYLLTAHHGDDLMETMLMRMVRGSRIRGYGGFPRIVDRGDYQLVRPLIHLTKEELLAYDELHQIPYVLDASNEKEIYTRNRFRKAILPTLKKENPKVHQKFYQFSTMLLAYDDFVSQECLRLYPTIVESSILSCSKWANLHPVLQHQVLAMLFEQTYPDQMEQIRDCHLEQLIHLLKGTKPNGTISLPKGLVAKRAYDQFWIEMKREISGYDQEFSTEILPNGHQFQYVQEGEGAFVCRLASSELALPLRIRTRKPGDRVSIHGKDGHKKLTDLWIDRKVPKEERNQYPIVVDQNDVIVWIPGIIKTKFSKTKEEKYDIILRYC